MASGLHIVPIEEYRIKNAMKENYFFISYGTDFNFVKVGLKTVHTF
jgi:hypothetical protein